MYLFVSFGLLIVFIFLIGLILPKNRVFTKTAVLNANTELVYQTIIDFKNQANWRKDVKEIQVIDENTWTEIPQKGKPITFKINQKKLNELFEIEIIEPQNFSGYWIGTFKPTDKNSCEIRFEEVIIVSNPFLRTLTYLFVNLDKTMDLYLLNLKEKLSKENGY